MTHPNPFTPPVPSGRFPSNVSSDNPPSPPRVNAGRAGKPILKPGDVGEAVAQIQQKLTAMRYYFDAIDGGYGPVTETAVMAFQRKNNLPATGFVDAATLRALGFAVVDSSQSNETSAFTPDRVAKMFPDAPIANIRTHLPRILNALLEVGLADRPMILMALATIRAESAGFAPISEYQSKYNTSGKKHPFDLYDFRKDLGNGAVGDGNRYKGRGFIQLTGKHNYTKYSKALGLGTALVDNPELANDPTIAARLLARFLKDAEPRIREALAQRNYAAARRTVNGGTHGLSQFQTAYETGAQVIV